MLVKEEALKCELAALCDIQDANARVTQTGDEPSLPIGFLGNEGHSRPQDSRDNGVGCAPG